MDEDTRYDSKQHPCGKCLRNIKSGAIFCNGHCRKWLHFKCLHINYSDIKKLTAFEKKNWICPDCNIPEENKDILNKQNVTNNDSNLELEESLHIAAEIGKSLLEENDKLKQELHDTKLKESTYILELEDKLLEKDELIKNLKNKYLIEKGDYYKKLQGLESKLNKENNLKETIFLQAEQDKENYLKELHTIKKPCEVCKIYKEETQNMTATIRSLEMQLRFFENNDRDGYTTNEINSNKCKTVLKQENMRLKEIIIERENTIAELRGGKTVQATNESLEVVKNRTKSGIKNSKSSVTTFTNNTHHSAVFEQVKPPDQLSTSRQNKRSLIKHKPRILILADSHGRKCSEIIRNNIGEHFETISFVKPNAKFNNVVEHVDKIGYGFTKDDYILVLGGTNDFNESNIEKVKIDVSKLSNIAKRTNVIYPGIPLRFDGKNIDKNKKIKVTNEAINKQLFKMAQHNCNILTVSKFNMNRNDHTKHGLHLNFKGKNKLCSAISQKILEHFNTSKAPSPPQITTYNHPVSDRYEHHHPESEPQTPTSTSSTPKHFSSSSSTPCTDFLNLSIYPPLPMK